MHVEVSGHGNGKIMKPQPQPQANENAPSVVEAERKRDEAALDDALENTFPASDPVSIEQPEGNQKRGDKA